MHVRRALLVLVVVAGLVFSGCGRPKPEMEFTVQQVGKGLEIRVEMTGFAVPRDGHVHIRIDDGPEVMVYTPVYTIPEIAPGIYKVSVDLSDKQHRDLAVGKSKTVEIK